MPGIKRPNVSKKARAVAIEFVASELRRRITDKGPGTFASIHEIMGVISEEYNELKDAVHKNEMIDVEKELADIAVACIFSLACIHEDHLSW